MAVREPNQSEQHEPLNARQRTALKLADILGGIAVVADHLSHINLVVKLFNTTFSTVGKTIVEVHKTANGTVLEIERTNLATNIEHEIIKGEGAFKMKMVWAHSLIRGYYNFMQQIKRECPDDPLVEPLARLLAVRLLNEELIERYKMKLEVGEDGNVKLLSA